MISPETAGRTKVLVAYASRHGATQGIAERIAETLREAGLNVELARAHDVKSIAGYDAFVIGSAAYMFHWLKEAGDLVHRNRATLADKPVWLFSSGPLGTDALDTQGRDQKVAAIPKEMNELRASVKARDHRVFFGAYDRDRKPVGLAERFDVVDAGGPRRSARRRLPRLARDRDLGAVDRGRSPAGRGGTSGRRPRHLTSPVPECCVDDADLRVRPATR